LRQILGNSPAIVLEHYAPFVNAAGRARSGRADGVAGGKTEVEGDSGRLEMSNPLTS
jgi:hypothetical protein